MFSFSSRWNPLSWFTRKPRPRPRRRAARLLMEILEDRCVPATYTVTGVGDAGTGAGLVGDLRYCISTADSDTTPAIIHFDSSLGGQTVTLGSSLNLDNTNGQPIEIDGPTSGITISGGGNTSNFSPFIVSTTATLNGLTIANGHNSDGGAIINQGTLTLTNCTLSDNSANTGGGILNAGTLTLTNCTLSNNSANFGGAVCNNDTLTLTNCTLSGNSAHFTGAGIFFNTAGSATLVNTIVANSTGSDLHGTFAGTNDIIDDGSGSGLTNPLNVNPQLSALGNYGGPTETFALLPGSPAIAAGTPIGAPATDQRSALRPLVPSIGAYEGADFIVTSTSNDSSVIGSLPYEVGQANLDTSGEQLTISFDATDFADPQTITLAATLDLTNTHAGDVIDVEGSTAGVTIDGNHAVQVFNVGAGTTAIFNNFTIAHGSSTNGGGIYNRGTLTLTSCTLSDNSVTGVGGAILNAGALTVSDCTLSGNSSGNAGGGIYYSRGTLTLTNCTLSGNTATNGGGIFSDQALTLANCTLTGNQASADAGGIYSLGSLMLTNSTLSGNSAQYSGGGITNVGTLTLTNCTLSGNSTTNSGGGGINNGGSLTLTNCTLSGNSAGTSGGGINNGGTLTVTNCTLSGNSAKTGGGIENEGGSATLINTIVANSTSGGDLGGSFTGTNDLIGDGSGSGLTSPLSGDPKLSALGYYGGPTETFALLPGSPALGAGTSTGAPTTDQRGAVRSNPPSIGDFEGVGYIVTNTSNDGSVTGSLPDEVSLANADTTGGQVTIAFDPTEFATSQIITLAATLDLDNTTAGDVIAIEGPRAGVTIDGNQAVQAFIVDHNTTAIFNNLTVAHGSATTNGGGIANSGTLTLTHCTLSDNSASDAGGGIINVGTLTLAYCTLSGNSASTNAGGIGNVGTLTLTDCTLSDNSATDNGGGIFNYRTLTLTNCTLSGNSASRDGGGINNTSTLTLTNCTLSGNSATSDGGGLNNTGTLTLTNCTLSGNSAQSGGGLFRQAGTATLINTIVANSTSGGDLAGTFTGTNDLIGDGSGFGLTSPLSGKPQLSVLGYYGGPTETFALMTGSPAIKAGGAVTTVATVDNDAHTITVATGTGGAIAVTPGTYYLLINSRVFTVTGVSGDTFTLNTTSGIRRRGRCLPGLRSARRGAARRHPISVRSRPRPSRLPAISATPSALPFTRLAWPSLPIHPPAPVARSCPMASPRTCPRD